jgi:hypothetical protein
MKDIPGFEGVYSITESGNVWSQIRNIWLKPNIVRGYKIVALTKNKKRKNFSVHRLMGFAFLGLVPELQVDHIDRDPGNNELSNLRLATGSQNHFNVNPRTGCRSGIKGVSWAAGRNKWRAQTTVNGKNYHIGCFEDKFQAKAAYDAMCEKLHGEFFCTGARIEN